MTDIPLDNLVPSDSKYLTKEDAGEAGLVVTIKGFKQGVEVGDDHKTVMGFVEDVKPMVLNKTNLNILRHYFPEAKSTGDLKGKSIVVYNDPTVDYAGKIVGGLRIKMPQAPANPPTAGQQNPAQSFEDSEIPF